MRDCPKCGNQTAKDTDAEGSHCLLCDWSEPNKVIQFQIEKNTVTVTMVSKEKEEKAAEMYRAVWERRCLSAIKTVENAPPHLQAEYAEEAALDLLGTARYMGGVACPECGGLGEKAYGSSSTWKGGAGGQTMTGGVCDKCWGSGRNDRKGVNLRELHNMKKQAVYDKRNVTT